MSTQMLNIPFSLEPVPSRGAAKALQNLALEQPGLMPVLLGDADIFATEWAESVDMFEPPEEVLAEANEIDLDAWFNARLEPENSLDTAFTQATAFNLLCRAIVLPFDLALIPFRQQSWSLTGRRPVMRETSMIKQLQSQLAELEATGERTDEELNEIREIITDLDASGAGVFPDPVDYITPRHSATMAAGMVEVREPWEAAAWLQHGTYAICAPKPLLVALCKWLWEQHGGRIITASVDSIGFEMEQPIETPHDAEEVLRRFSALGASEVNADHRGTGGSSLIGAPRLWVWWD